MHVNKVHHVTTFHRVAAKLGEDEDWLSDVASEMEIEDGVIWVYGVGEDGVQAFTDSASRISRTSSGCTKTTQICSNVLSRNLLSCGPGRMGTLLRTRPTGRVRPSMSI